MTTLGIDTTAKSCSVGIVHDGEILADMCVNCTLEHSEKLMPIIKMALDGCKIKVSDIDCFALSAGPGSFTGVRIGVATIKGLAFGSGKPCVPLSALEVLAYNSYDYYPGKIICPVMDSRHRSVYNALFKDGKRLCEDRCIDIDALKAELEAVDDEIIFVGDGCKVCSELISEKHKAAQKLLCYPHGYSVAMLGWKKFNENPDGDYSDVTLTPIYLRSSQAERTKEFG